jgi:CPA1 family monovalent cation:H+ antiporter
MQDASVLQILVLLGIAIVGLTVLARWVQIAPPIVLLLGGVALAFVPWLEHVRLPPEVVLLIFLPALLYWESLNTSLREIRANLRVVMIDSILLVLATAGAVAVLGHALGLSWPVAWVLGAVLAPTDATAVSAVARRMPRRQITILRAESLVNDGTALVVFAIAVEVASGREHFGWSRAVGAFVASYAGGVVLGLAVAWLTARVRTLMHDPLLENTVNALSPFVAFLLAEEIHASGVLAVVACGLWLSQVNPRLVGAQTRLRSRAFWQLTAFFLNGALFVLVGLQLRSALANLTSYTVTDAVAGTLLVGSTVIGTRLLWMYTVPYVVKLIDRRPHHQSNRLRARQRFPIAWSGFRGAVSLAAALAVPATMADGSAFPARDLIIVVTFGVILVTLLQGLTLPAVLRWSRLPEDHSERAEVQLARETATKAALAALPTTAARLGVDSDVAERLRTDLDQRLWDIAEEYEDSTNEQNSNPRGEPDSPASPAAPSPREQERLLRRALLSNKRTALVTLRDAHIIDDIVLRRVQATLDNEEVRLAAGHEHDLE